ncbi:nucleoredoxin isoform X1 [Protopterus annectens]|uniref:nucleoredoxin isoform X1 n=1 Tax=Protopterus annectens TaxID=7888 RepID=UPI001CFA7B3B|nr:nucleoredoxin isoform X1 [Protopterus annectens]
MSEHCFLVELLGERLLRSRERGSGEEEVDVHSLAAGCSLMGLYFGSSLSAPCKQFNVNLAEFYSKFKESGGGTRGRQLEIVFVSSDQDHKKWQEFVQDMPWLALPFKEKHKKLKLWNRYRISNIPSLVFIDTATGKIVCRNGLLVIRDDPEGLEFPWGPIPFYEVIAGSLLQSNGQLQDSSILEGSYVGVYFSAHWCPPCRALTRVLVESYCKIKESGQKFEIVFVSADRSEDSFKQYFSEMPWLAVPYGDEGRRSRLNRLYGIQGIPTLIILDPKGDIITRQGRVEVLNDVDCKEFPWHPKPVLELTESNAVQLNEGPCLVLFVDSEEVGELDAAKQMIQPLAEKIIAKYKAKDEEAPLLFFVAGEDDVTDSLRDFTNLPEAAPLLTILDMAARAKYVMDVEEITPEIVEAFVADFTAEKLKPEPI